MIYIFHKHHRPARPILDPTFRKAHNPARIPDELPSNSLESHYGLSLRQIYSAYLIAAQTNTGHYVIFKNRAAPMPTRPVTKATLLKYIQLNLNNS